VSPRRGFAKEQTLVIRGLAPAATFLGHFAADTGRHIPGSRCGSCRRPDGFRRGAVMECSDGCKPVVRRWPDRPQAAKRRWKLIPQIPFVVFHIILLQQRNKFCLEIEAFVVLFLILDIFNDRIDIGTRHAKRSKTFLPRELLPESLLDPSRRIRFYKAHRLRNAYIRRQ